VDVVPRELDLAFTAISSRNSGPKPLQTIKRGSTQRMSISANGTYRTGTGCQDNGECLPIIVRRMMHSFDHPTRDGPEDEEHHFRRAQPEELSSAPARAEVERSSNVTITPQIIERTGRNVGRVRPPAAALP
jgi:hypothetical protein